MSLDVYLTTRGEAVPRIGTGVFVRDNGATRELTAEEVSERWPGSEVAPQEYESDEVYSRNITHNLGKMAAEAGVYDALWHPAELDPAIKARIEEREAANDYHGPEGSYALESSFTVYARELIEPLETGLALLKSEPERFRAMNPNNGWGNYEGLVEFVEEYLNACKEHPTAEVRVSR